MTSPPDGAPSLYDRLQRTLAGSYTLERELGGGGMSRVFVAEEIRLRRKVVIKVLSPELAQGISVERFEREIQLTASLQQANIVPVLAAGDTDGLPYYVMPLVEGESVRSRVGEGRLPIADVVSILRDVVRALNYAHRRGIVHRDIKPDNVLLSSGAAVVTDFGIAKAISAARTQDGAASLTQTGSAIGSPAYMAPEQAAGDPDIDHRVDIYAVGCLGYELLTGQAPFTGPSVQRVIAAHITEQPQSVSSRRADTPKALADLVMRALAKNPADRPRSAEELLHALDGIAVSGNQAAVAPPRGRKIIGWSLAAALIAVTGAVVLLVRGHTATAGSSAATRTLAVLPIENVGGDSAREYLADGMTTELAGNLRQTPGLSVVGDLSTFRFKHTQLAPSEIARTLKVGMLLTGKLQAMGDRIRLQMQLNDADGKLLWSNRYDREMKDNFALQDSIAAAVTREMQVVLTPASAATMHAGRTENPEAHDLYLRAMFEKNKLSEQGLDRAVTFFNQALALDSNYARAWAGLSFAYDMLADAYRPSHQYHLLSLRAAQRAVASDSMLAEGRVALGFEIGAATWDFATATREIEAGLALDPNAPDALFMGGGFLGATGQTAEALAYGERLIRLDPLSAMARLLRASVLAFARRWQEVLPADSAIKRLDPSVVYFDALDGAALRQLGRPDESVAAYQRFQNVTGMPAYGLAVTYGRMGKRAEARQIADSLAALSRTQWVDPTFIAAAYDGAGDRDRAMRWVETAFKEKSFSLRFDGAYWLDPLRDDPRFKTIWARVKSTVFKN